MPRTSSAVVHWQATSVLAASGGIVLVSILLAIGDVQAFLNTAFTMLVGTLMAIVVVAAAVGHGRGEAPTRVAGLGLVVALIAAIQLSQLWNDDLVTPSVGAMLAALGGLGLVGAVEARRLEFAPHG
jgi:hypothetical protein